MTPTRIRLLFRDLAAGSAFASMAISGVLPSWSVGTFAFGLLLAVGSRRVLTRWARVAAIGLGLGALLLYALVVVGELDLVLAACTFAGLITVHRMLTEPTASVDNQVQLTSMLMVAGGAALSADLLFALCLMAFSVTGCLALALGVVERAADPGEAIPIRPVMRQVSLGTLGAMVGAAAFFALFPRLNWNVAARPGGRGGGAKAGLSDKVSLEGSGSIKTSPRIVARIQLRPDPEIAFLGYHWVARTLDTFDGTTWSGRGQPLPARPAIYFAGLPPKSVEQRVELLSAYGTEVLIGLEVPLQFDSASAVVDGAPPRPVGLIWERGREVRFERNADAFTYRAHSLPDQLLPEASDAEARELALPAVDPRIRSLAQQVVGTERDPERVARRLEAYLSTEYGYTLDLPEPGGDPLPTFLFERRKGHCEYFASALAVMLRTLGIRSRVVLGYYGGERVADRYAVRAGDAHAWVQAYLPGRGYLTLDPTPAGFRSAQAGAWTQWLTRSYETFDVLWRTTIVEYSFRDQVGFARKLFDRRSPTLPRLSRLRPVLTGAALLACVWVLWRLARQRLSRPRREATRLLEQMEKAAARMGFPQLPNEPIEALAGRLRGAAHPRSAAFDDALRRYLEARFGERPLARGERGALLAPLQAASK